MKRYQLFLILGLVILSIAQSVFASRPCLLVSGDCPNEAPPSQHELKQRAINLLHSAPTPKQALNNERNKVLSAIYSDDPAVSLIKQGFNAPAIRFCYWAASRAKDKAYYSFDPFNQYIQQRNMHKRCDCYHLSEQTITQAQSYVNDFNTYLKVLFTNPLTKNMSGSTPWDNAKHTANYALTYDEEMNKSLEAISSQNIVEKCASLEKQYTQKLSTCSMREFHLFCPTYNQHYCYLWGTCNQYGGAGWRQND